MYRIFQKSPLYVLYIYISEVNTYEYVVTPCGKCTRALTFETLSQEVSFASILGLF